MVQASEEMLGIESQWSNGIVIPCTDLRGIFEFLLFSVELTSQKNENGEFPNHQLKNLICFSNLVRERGGGGKEVDFI